MAEHDNSDLVQVAETIEDLVEMRYLEIAHRLAESGQGSNFLDSLRRKIRKSGEKPLEPNVVRLLELHAAGAICLRPASLGVWVYEAAASMQAMLAEEGYPRDEFNAWVEPICQRLLIHDQEEAAP